VYLRHQGVRFFVGAFDGFDWCARCDELRPNAVGVCYGQRVEGALPFPSPVFEDEVEAELTTDPAHTYRRDADFFVLASPLRATKEAACRFARANEDILNGRWPISCATTSVMHTRSAAVLPPADSCAT
jgi:hypothetical protein